MRSLRNVNKLLCLSKYSVSLGLEMWCKGWEPKKILSQVKGETEQNVPVQTSSGAILENNELQAKMNAKLNKLND